MFVINTMGMGGAENALLELFNQLDLKKNEVSLFVVTGQGELISRLPKEVRLLNKTYYPISLYDKTGKVQLFITVLKAIVIPENIPKRIIYIMKNLKNMIKQRKIQKDKLFWRILSDGTQKLEQEYDLAIAYLEGGSAYYVASHVKAKKKVAFIHINYNLSGYNRKLDENCYLEFDHIFTVSKSVKDHFLSVYPECQKRTEVFYNLIDREKIMRKALEKGGFTDDYDGFRILTVGRLVPQKAYDVEIEAMKILKRSGKPFRWYVLGDGELRKKLEKQVCVYGLKEDFLFLGMVENPFPYYAQCDLYVHASYFEGKSIAIEEAQILGCAILVSDYSGVREQVEDEVDGKICRLEPKELAECILDFANDPQKRISYGNEASKKGKRRKNQIELNKLMTLLSEIE